MKAILNVAILFCYFFISQASSCNKHKHHGNCEGIACTMMFAAVNIKVTEGDGKTVKLDEAYTQREGDNEKLKYDAAFEGAYTVLDDSYLNKLKNNSAKFVFTGIKDGKEVVKETYEISADCCHIKKVSGAEQVVVQ